jgi:hypothetical protein
MVQSAFLLRQLADTEGGARQKAKGKSIKSHGTWNLEPGTWDKEHF